MSGRCHGGSVGFAGCVGVVFVLVAVSFAASADQVSYEPTDNYSMVDIQGWKVRVHKGLECESGEEALDVLRFELYLVSRWVPEGPLAELRKVPVWIRDDTKGKNHYHPNRGWLVENSYNPEKEKSVDIERAKEMVRVAHDNVNVLMHELAHAYHDRVLGFDDARILEAYKKAKASGKYESVLKLGGKTQRHYAMTDHKEYFAESTEAFFGCNDFYPFVRVELEEFDPDMYELLREIWLGK